MMLLTTMTEFISSIPTLLFYVTLLVSAFITGRWLVRKERNY
jgi:hypothetical protein